MSYTDLAASHVNEGFVVAINIVAKEGKGDAMADVLQGLIAPTTAEKGVKFFVLAARPPIPRHSLSTSFTSMKRAGRRITKSHIS